MTSIALQLYAVREALAADTPGTLSAIAEMGFAGVELYHANYERPASQWRAWLAERGLRICGVHSRLDALLGDAFERTVAFHQELGSTRVVIASMPPERRATRQHWIENAALFNDLAARLHGHGLRLGYHNHVVEFVPLDGECPWDTLFSRATPGVIMQLDMGHALEAGADPVAVLRQYPGRAETVHLAEFSRANPNALLGEGDVAWAGVLAAIRETGATQWLIVEQETYPYPQLECARRCLQNLRRIREQ